MSEQPSVISETVSEKRKRGRPRLDFIGNPEQVCALFPDVTTKRGKHNKLYVVVAIVDNHVQLVVLTALGGDVWKQSADLLGVSDEVQSRATTFPLFGNGF